MPQQQPYTIEVSEEFIQSMKMYNLYFSIALLLINIKINLKSIYLINFLPQLALLVENIKILIIISDLARM
jgi:hypothetical protein